MFQSLLCIAHQWLNGHDFQGNAAVMQETVRRYKDQGILAVSINPGMQPRLLCRIES